MITFSPRKLFTVLANFGRSMIIMRELFNVCLDGERRGGLRRRRGQFKVMICLRGEGARKG